MPRKYNRITKEELEKAIKVSNSYAECLRKLNLAVAGGNYKLLQQRISKFQIDISHMKHQAWNQGNIKIPFEFLTSPVAIKSRLIAERGRKCQSCNNTHWLDSPISIELEHVDGDNRNNSKDNLLLLCPNCHSQTPTYRNRKR